MTPPDEEARRWLEERGWTLTDYHRRPDGSYAEVHAQKGNHIMIGGDALHHYWFLCRFPAWGP